MAEKSGQMPISVWRENSKHNLRFQKLAIMIYGPDRPPHRQAPCLKGLLDDADASCYARRNENASRRMQPRARAGYLVCRKISVKLDVKPLKWDQKRNACPEGLQSRLSQGLSSNTTGAIGIFTRPQISAS